MKKRRVPLPQRGIERATLRTRVLANAYQQVARRVLDGLRGVVRIERAHYQRAERAVTVRRYRLPHGYG